MALAIGDIIQIRDFQTFLGQLLLNVFMYRIVALPVPSEGETPESEILAAFSTQVAQTLASEQSGLLNHYLCRLDNLSNGIDFAELPVDFDGVISGDAAPSFTALNFILRRTTGITRNGSKRMGGLSENSVTGNSINIASDRVAVLEVAMGRGINAPVMGGVLWAEPVIVGRTLEIDEEGKETYVLDLAKINPVQGATMTAVSTQRTRKAGRGV